MTLQLQNRIAGLERKILPHIEAKLKMRCAVWCERKMENQNSALEIIKLHMVNWEKIVNQSQDSSTWKVFRRNHKKARALTRAFWDIRISSLGFGGCPSALLFLFIKTSTLQTFLFHTTKHHNLQNAFTKTKSNHWSSRSLLLYYAIKPYRTRNRRHHGTCKHHSSSPPSPLHPDDFVNTGSWWNSC